MEREVVIGNRALEEFLERLLRWDELCAQLRELYYKYLDLAAFRSEKCYFPGRRCVRSWGRQYDIGDLTLMWLHIANTAPLCGKLMKTLAKVEYKIRLKALESLRKYSGVEKRMTPSGKYEIVNFQLKRPVYGYLVLWGDKLYIIWGEFDGLPKNNQLRAAEIERRVVDVIEQYRRVERVEVEVEEYEVDREYERLWLEIPLLESVSKLLGGRSKAPVALFRNLGWLLSDDSRFRLEHASSNPSQVAMRAFDWIAIATYAKSALQSSPLVFKLSVYNAAETKNGINPLIVVQPIGMVTEVIQAVYEQFRIALNGTERVIARGYAVLNALREEALKREGLTYVVDDVGAWIAFSATTTMLVLGDGYITPFVFGITAKSPSETTPEEEVVGVKELAKALGGMVARKDVRLRVWHLRSLLPVPPTPSFEKAVRLYDALVNYPAAATVEINGTTYLLDHYSNGQFAIGKKKATELYEAVKRFGLRMKIEKDVFIILYTQLRELARFVPVRFLNDLEKNAVREIRPVPSLDLEAVRRVLEDVAKMARIVVGLRLGCEYIRIIPHDKSKVWEIVAMLKMVGIRTTMQRPRYIF